MASLLRLIPAAAAAVALTAPAASSGPVSEQPPPSATGAEAARGAPGIETEAGLRAVLDPLEARYEAACRGLGEAIWRRATGAEPAGSDSVQAARGRLAEVYADSDLARAIGAWGNRRTVARDPTLTRRLQLWRTTRVTASIALDPEVSALEESLAARLERGGLKLGEREVPREEVERALLAADPAARRRAWRALSGLARDARPEVKKLVALRTEVARRLRAPSYFRLMVDAQDIHSSWLSAVLQTLIVRTDAAHEALMSSLKEALGGAPVEPWDLDYAMLKRAERTGAAAAAAAALKPGAAVAAAGRLLEAFGFPVPEAAPGPVQTALASRGLGVTVAIPGDYRLREEDASGMDPLALLDRTLRRHGEALHVSHTRASSPMLKGYPWVPGARNGPFAHGMSETPSAFLRDPLVLRKVLGLDERAAALVVEELRARHLMRLRRLLRALALESTLYVPDEAGPDRQYEKLTQRILGVTLSVEDASPWYADPLVVLRPATSQDELLGAVLAAVVHERIAGKLGDERLGSGRTASWLAQRCFADGETLPLHERLARAVEAGLDVDSYLRSLGISR